MKQVKYNRIYFKEEQKFNQWWLKLILYLSVLAALGPLYYGTIVQLSTGVPWGDKPASDTVLIVIDLLVTLLMAGILWLIFGTKMITEIKNDGLHIRFKPFLRNEKVIQKENIEKFDVVKYNPVTDYGGWGVKRGRKGNVINVSGNKGLYLVLKGGKKFMIGTARPEAMKHAINKLMSNYE